MQRTEKKIVSNILKGSLGNREWFDWYVYASFSIYFAPSFFPSHDKTAALLSTAGVFAIGFLMRPLGSLVLGKYADQHGRRAALTLSVLIMAAGSLVIAITPELSCNRNCCQSSWCWQGYSRIIVGWRYGTSANLSEMASSGHRGLRLHFNM